jgi:hypothetical protein
VAMFPTSIEPFCRVLYCWAAVAVLPNMDISELHTVSRDEYSVFTRSPEGDVRPISKARGVLASVS